MLVCVLLLVTGLGLERSGGVDVVVVVVVVVVGWG